MWLQKLGLMSTWPIFKILPRGGKKELSCLISAARLSGMKRSSCRLLWRDATVAVLYLAGESAGGVPNQAAEKRPRACLKQLPRQCSSLLQLTFWNQWVSKMETARRCIKTSVADELTVAVGRLLASLLFSVTSPNYGRREVVVRMIPRRFQVLKPCVEYILG